MDIPESGSSNVAAWCCSLNLHLDKVFQSQSLTTIVKPKHHHLKIMIVGQEVADITVLVPLIQRELGQFIASSGVLPEIETVQMYGREPDDPVPDWQVEFPITDCPLPSLAPPESLEPAKKRSLWHSVSQAVTGTAQSIGDAALKAPGAMVETTTQMVGSAAKTVAEAGSTVADVALKAPGVVMDTTSGIASSTAQTVVNAGGAMVDAVSKAPGAVAKTTTTLASSATKTVADAGNAVVETTTTLTSSAAKTVTDTGNAVVSSTISTTVHAAHSVANTAVQTTEFVGQALEQVAENRALRHLTRALKADWLLEIIGQVDVEKAEKVVEKLQTKYPQESADQIAHRIIQQKVVYVVGTGFTSSLVPGFAAGWIALDLAATIAIQAEMGYQIAAAYGLDLAEAARKGEILAIFGAAFGTDYVAKLGLKALLRNIPVAGAVMGASTNAVALYAVGYAACRFYGAKGKALESEVAAQEALEAGTHYLEQAAGQQILMDEMLAHMVQASHPQKPWTQILPELEQLNLPPDSLQVIEAHIGDPTPLEQLLQGVDQDYGVAILAQCQRIAQQDQIITPEEAEILAQIQSHLANLSGELDP
jgi:uncharacterized protein (DUF697 family)